jgi:hypothetical protein
MVSPAEQLSGGERFPRRGVGVPLAVRGILRQLRVDREPEDVQRRVVARDAKRGMFLPAELDALREAGWIDQPDTGPAGDVEGR